MDGYTGFTILTVIHLARALSHSDHAPPFFISEPYSAAVAEGQNVTLTCEAGPIGKVSVRWTYNGSEISPQSRIGITMMGSSLNIASFVAASEAGEHPSSHAGIYRCVAQNRVGAIVSRLVALTSARLESCHQKLVHETVSVTAGNTVILPCRGISKPSLSSEIVFEHNGAALKTSSRHRLLPSHSLQIENTTSSDGGTYRCICPSTFPPHRIVASVIQLKVETVSNDVPSEFISTSPRDVQVIEGETLTLECAAAGWPVPLITWLRYGGVLPMSRHSQHAGILRISEVQKVDEGTYICRAENTAGPPKIHVVFVDVLEPPKILLPPTDHTATEGSRVTFGCKAEGSPRPTVAWYHNARPVVNSSLAKINSDGALVLMDIQENQSGMYQCIVSNQVNSSSASARLIVRPATPTSLGHQRHGPSDKKIDRSSVHPLRRSTVTMPTTQPLDFPDGVVESYSRIPDTGTAKDSTDESKSLLMQSDGERSGGPRKSKGTRTYERNRPRKTTTQRNAGVSLVPPSKPTVSLVSDTSVQLRWSIGPSEGLNVTLFKVQFKEIKTRKHRKSAGWHTIDEDIAPDVSEFTVSSLKPGSTYQFRLVAIYSNNDNKHGPNSDRLLMSMTGQKTKVPLTPPIIVAVHPLSVSEIDISWQFMPAKREVVNGFMIHYKPYETDLGYKQHVVHGSDEREVLLSNLLTDTTYSLRMQSFNAEGFSDYSNTVVKKTMGPSDNITDNYYPLNNHTPLFPPSGDDHRPFYNDRGATGDQGSTPRSGIESQVPLNRASYSQQNSDLLFVVLGGVLGAVFIVVVFVIVFCFWRQRQQQLLIATLQARAKANNIQRPSLHANDFAAASSVNYEMESVNNTHPDTSRRKRTQQQSRKGGDIPGYVEGRPSKGANGAGVVGGFRSGNQRCHLYQPTTQEEWKSEFPFIVQSLGRRPPPIPDAYASADDDKYGSRSDVDISDGDSSLASSSCPARRQWTSSAGDCGAAADDDEIYNSELLPYPPPRSSSSSHPHAAVSSFRPLHQHHHHHLPSSKIHDDDEQTMNIICDCDQFSCQPHPLSTEPLAPSGGDAVEKLTDCHNPHHCHRHHRHRGDEGNNSQSGQSDSLPRSCALSDCSSSSSSASSSASCNQRCRARQQYNRETNDSGVYDETSDCKHHSTADCRAAGDQCQASA